mgnify:CR=1 FL=1
MLPKTLALIDDDARARRDIVHRLADLEHGAGDLVTEHLRRALERDRLAALVAVGVRLAGPDVEVGATDADLENATADAAGRN